MQDVKEGDYITGTISGIVKLSTEPYRAEDYRLYIRVGYSDIFIRNIDNIKLSKAPPKIGDEIKWGKGNAIVCGLFGDKVWIRVLKSDFMVDPYIIVSLSSL